MPRLGVVGTMVWDTIHTAGAGDETPVEAWGGIAYSLAAADAALPRDWSLFPIIKVGSDLREPADTFFATLGRLDSLDGVRSVAEPNNRVELFYRDASRRCERLRGGVPAWKAPEIAPLLRSCDALYVNFVAGWELDLSSSLALRDAVDGPVYGDVHSLMLGVGTDGVRALRPLENWRAWVEAFDIIQLNEDELTTLADGRDDPWTIADEVLGPRTKALLVTLGERGSAWVSTAGFLEHPALLASCQTSVSDPGSLRRGRLEAAWTVENGDPTGCGDVWGATCFSVLLGGGRLDAAMLEAGRAAARNAAFVGAWGLNADLKSAAGFVARGEAR